MRLIIKKEREIENSEADRRRRFGQLSGEEKMKELCYLIELTILMGGELRLKKPGGRGIVIKK
ncbi:MAG: hypothetical protein KDC80_25010 [Saprospiraceae bacterium]|nr:hypothetical protein [Saprospiraceae bacterium]